MVDIFICNMFERCILRSDRGCVDILLKNHINLLFDNKGARIVCS